jgi:hypothetical protein
VAGDEARPEDGEALAAMLAAPPVLEAPAFARRPEVLFVSNMGGERAVRAGPRRAPLPARSVSAVNLRRPVVSADGLHVYFTSDTQGDEAYRIMRIVLATGAIEDVAVDGHLRREGPWLTETGRVFFTARAMTARGAVLFEQPTAAGAAPREILRDEDADVARVRADGQEALLLRAPLHDLLWAVLLPAEGQAGARRVLYPTPGATSERVRIFDVAYSPDGRRVYVAASASGDTTVVIALDARTGREVARATEARVPGGDIQSLRAEGAVVAYIADLGTHHEVRVLDARTLRRRPDPRLPLGSEVPGAMHPTNGGLSLSRMERGWPWSGRRPRHRLAFAWWTLGPAAWDRSRAHRRRRRMPSRSRRSGSPPSMESRSRRSSTGLREPNVAR